MTKIKLCGIRTHADVEIVNEFKPDFCGYIFAPTWREITLDAALDLAKRTDKGVKRVGVFVNRDIEFVSETLLGGAVDMLQLHGQEDRAYEEALFSKLINNGVKNPAGVCIKARRIKNENDIKGAENTLCDYLLLDAFSKKDIGGTGESFDWSLIKNISKPYFLAGGINSSNIRDAVQLTRPYAADVSSGIETDRKKDRAKVQELMKEFFKSLNQVS